MLIICYCRGDHWSPAACRSFVYRNIAAERLR